MAKALAQPPPSSAVARLLDPGAAARAIEAPPPAAADYATASPPARPAPAAAPERELVKRELTLTPATDETFTELIDIFRRATGTRLSASHVARAMLIGVRQCLPSLQRELGRLGPLKLPGNARHHDAQRAEFERRLARAFVTGVRAAAAFEPE